MHTNRLIEQKSPYLLQHAHNPVDWHAWNEEAFEKAREEQKPIFLSIGYSTCHWCHVMERESFESEEIAEILNLHFVPIKVDREERPDIDRIYMLFVQATTGGGGWPMSVWLTPELKPFFGGTYFPPTTRWGRPGFREVLLEIARAWSGDRARIVESSEQVLGELEKQVQLGAGAHFGLNEETLERAFNVFRRSFDTRLGGFGAAPKFPRPVVHDFLVRFSHRTGDREALDMVVHTLEAMARGGMHDQLGGGFHRYSVDDYWFVPHFEKMLYDQAQLATSYLEAYQITGERSLAATARRIFAYVLRDLTGPERAFYSAEDADSAADPAQPNEKGEGAFYIWTQAEIEQALGSPAAGWFCHRYGVEPAGNVQNDPQGEFTGCNILFEAHTAEQTAAHFGVPGAEVRASLDASAAILLALRGSRPRPHLDDKILTAWNGLMISAFSKGGQILGDESYARAAREAAEFILARMVQPGTGTLLRRYRQGEAAIDGFLDDYALFVQGLLDLYETVFDVRYLDAAIRLTEKQIELFEDAANGAFFSTAVTDSRLVLRMKDDYDGAEPSGNSAAALNLMRLARITGREDFRRAGERTLAVFGRRMAEQGVAMPRMLVALALGLGDPREIVIAGEKDAPETRALLDVVRSRFLPEAVIVLADQAGRDSLTLPGIHGMLPVDGKSAAYVCRNYACRLPVTEGVALTELLK